MRIEKPSAVPVLSWLFRLHIAQAPPTTCSAGGLSCVAAEKRVPSSTQHEATYMYVNLLTQKDYIYVYVCMYVFIVAFCMYTASTAKLKKL